MNVPIWLLAIAPPVFGSVGFLLCAMFTAGKVADLSDKLFHTECELEAEAALTESLVPKLRSANAEHHRLSDALATKQARIDRALACETPKAAHGVRKMAAILRGEL